MSSSYYSMGRPGSSRSKNSISREKLLENRSCMLRIGERLMRAGSEGTLVQRPIAAQNQNQSQNQSKTSANGLAQSQPAALEHKPTQQTGNSSKDLGNSTPGVTSTIDSSTERLLQRKQHINSSLLCDPELASCRTAPCSPNTARRSCATASSTSSTDRQLDSLMIQRLIERKKEMCRDHLKNKYSQHVALIMGNQDGTTKQQLSKEVLYGSHSTLHTLSSSSRSTRHGLQGSMSPPMVRSMPSSPSRMAYGGRSTRGVAGLGDQGNSTLPWDRQSGTRRPSLICTNSCSILERRDIIPDEDAANSKSTALVLRSEGGSCYPEPYCSSMQDRSGGFLSITSSQCSAPPGLTADRVDAGITGQLQQCHTAMDHQTHSLHSDRMKAIEEQIANLTELVHHAVVMAPGVNDPHSAMAGHKPFVNRPGTSSKPLNATAVEDSFTCTALALPASPCDRRLQQSLMSAQRKVNELRLQLSQLRRLQLLNQNSVSSMLRMAGDELVLLMCTHLAQSEEAASRKRVKMEEGRLHYLATEERILKQLSQLEDNVDCWQKNSALCPGQLSVTLRDVEEGAVNLQRVGEAVAVLKGEFTDLQAKMCSLLRPEVEAVRFLKEGPHRMDSMLKRVKALTEAIISLRRSVAESNSKALAEPLKDMDKSSRCPTMQRPPLTSVLMSSVSENQPEATKTHTPECSQGIENSDMNCSLISHATMPAHANSSQSRPITNKHVDQVLPEAQASLKISAGEELDLRAGPSDTVSGQKTSTASVSEQNAPLNLTLEAPPQLEKHQISPSVDQEGKKNPTIPPQQRSHAPSPGVGAGRSGRKEPIGAQPKPPRRPPEVKPKPQLRVPPAGFISTPAVAPAQRDNREGEEGSQTFMTELQDDSGGSETAGGSNHSVTAPHEIPALCHIPGKPPSSSLPTSGRPTPQSPPSTASAKWPPHAPSGLSSGQKASLCSLPSVSPSDPLRFSPSLTLTHLLPSSCQNTTPASASAASSTSQHSSTSSSSSSSSSPSSSTSSTRSPTSSSSSPPSPSASSLLPTLVSGMSLRTSGSDPSSLRHSKTRSRVTGSQHVA